MKMDYFECMDQLKRALLDKKSDLHSKYDPMTAAWLAFALVHDGMDQNPPLLDLIGMLERYPWAGDVHMSRDLGPLAMLGYLQRKRSKGLMESVTRAVEKIVDVDPDNRFSPLKDPVQLFMVAVYVDQVDSLKEIKSFLIDNIKGMMNGTLQRRILLSAALRELGVECRLPATLEPPTEAGDVIALIWWCNRYDPERETDEWWKTLDNLLDTLSYVDALPPSGDIRVLHVWELAMLYEALKSELPLVNPITLFNMYPMHPRIKEIARKPFYNGEYFDAVLEATKAFNDYVRSEANSHQSEVALMAEAFGDPNAKEIINPKIKFNALDSASLDYTSQQNEQRGLSLLARGIIVAFRHPKGHEAKDTGWGDISPYEALDQLITISYLMNRVEKAVGNARAN